MKREKCEKRQKHLQKKDVEGIYLPRTVERHMQINDVVCGAGSVSPQITSWPCYTCDMRI
jgi:hypothetical protein